MFCEKIKTGRSYQKADTAMYEVTREREGREREKEITKERSDSD